MDHLPSCELFSNNGKRIITTSTCEYIEICSTSSSSHVFTWTRVESISCACKLGAKELNITRGLIFLARRKMEKIKTYKRNIFVQKTVSVEERYAEEENIP